MISWFFKLSKNSRFSTFCICPMNPIFHFLYYNSKEDKPFTEQKIKIFDNWEIQSDKQSNKKKDANVKLQHFSNHRELVQKLNKWNCIQCFEKSDFMNLQKAIQFNFNYRKFVLSKNDWHYFKFRSNLQILCLKSFCTWNIKW